MKEAEEGRREKEAETRHADRRAITVGVLGIIGTIIGATIVVITPGPGMTPGIRWLVIFAAIVSVVSLVGGPLLSLSRPTI